jgi:BirA family biotin operon repressor/biotin-[acetyl-CoA-carboxylase] ligase
MLDFKFCYFGTLTSTNDKAKEFSKKGLSNIVVVADKQTKGRGRFNRTWSSGLGGLYMTIALRENDLDNVKYLTFIAAVSVAKTIRKISGLNAKVKWPNDVLLNDKKVCGILTETISGKENYALVGIGININQKIFSKNITKIATSLKIETNKNYNIKNISKTIIKNFDSLYNYYNKKNYNEIIHIWKKHSHTIGKKIKVKTLKGNYIGKAVDIDKDCSLISKLKNGKIKKIVEGDIFSFPACTRSTPF